MFLHERFLPKIQGHLLFDSQIVPLQLPKPAICVLHVLLLIASLGSHSLCSLAVLHNCDAIVYDVCETVIITTQTVGQAIPHMPTFKSLCW